MRCISLCWALAALPAGCSAPPITSDWEREHGAKLVEERAAPLPPLPQSRDLVRFDLLAPSEMRYFIDASSLRVGDGVVRYVMVVRSPEGAQNVSYEALRCPREYRVLALGRPEGGWLAQSTPWREFQRGMDRSAQYSLARNYFCPQRLGVQSVREALDALRSGVHPLLKQN